jgi:ribosomal protein S27E
MSGRKAIKMIGVWGSLRVISETEDSVPRAKKFRVKCRICGDERTMFGNNIRRHARYGVPGCRKCHHPQKGQFEYRHGLSNHPAYGVWEGMIRRCYSKKHIAYHRYGGRGITVCNEWRASPTAFINWLLNTGWNKNLQLDRRDNNGNYTPQNCRIVTARMNSNNKSTNRMLNPHGEELTISESARFYCINKTTIRERLNRGWSDKASVQPVN